MIEGKNSLLLFLIFFPRTQSPPSTTSTTDDPSTTNEPAAATTKPLDPSYRTALLVTALSVLHLILTAIISISILTFQPLHAQTLADALGIVSTILASIQYLPQIYTTYHLGRVGSLSLPMMLIQTPGSFVWAGSLAARLGTEGWSAWAVYVVTGTLQGVLLGMGIVFEVRARRAERDGIKRRIVLGQEEDTGDGVVGEESEETPLLGSER